MTPKEYRVETFQDMIDCTNQDNLDVFLKDIKNALTTCHSVEHIDGLTPMNYFTWIDDGKNDYNVSVQLKQKSKT